MGLRFGYGWSMAGGVFDVQTLIGNRVLVHMVAPPGQYWATIVDVKIQHSSEVEDDAINLSTFTLRLDDGHEAIAVGAKLSRIEFPETPKTSNTFTMPHEPRDDIDKDDDS